jgi:UDP-2,3-diacylglucosamine hydrolase
LLLERSVPQAGLLTRRALSAQERRDALIGWEAAKGIGALDIGQTVVVHQGIVVAVEAAEGSDAAILRAGEVAGTLQRKSAGAGLVVVKLVKPQQDLRFDLPAVGPKTIQTMLVAGASALVLEAERAIMLEPDEVVRAAGAADMALEVVSKKEDLL